MRYGSDPSGFLGKYQGLTAAGKSDRDICSEIVTVLARHDLTQIRMSSVFVDAFVNSSNFLVFPKE